MGLTVETIVRLANDVENVVGIKRMYKCKVPLFEFEEVEKYFF